MKFRQKQLLRYQQAEIESSSPVFVIYGKGGIPNKPAKIYLFDIKDVISEIVSAEDLNGDFLVISDLLNRYEIKPSEISNEIKRNMLSLI